MYDQVETEYPPSRTKYIKLYLQTNRSLRHSQSSQSVVHSYDSRAPGPGVSYDYIFPEKTTLAGYSRLRVFMSCKEHNDLDIYVQLRKLSEDGEPMEQSNIPLHELPPHIKSVKDVANVNPVKYLGPQGMLRASHREFDPAKSTEYWLFHPHQKAEYVTPGSIVELNICIWPMGIVFEKGEGLRLNIAGRTMALVEWDNPHVANQEPIFNKGVHNIHLGGEYAESYLLVPQI